MFNSDARRRWRIIALAWLAVVLAACSQPEDGADDDTTESRAETADSQAEAQPSFVAAAGHFQSTALELGDAMLAECQALDTRIDAFLAEPNEDSRSAAREAWQQCYRQWNRYLPFQQIAFTATEQADFERIRRLINVRPFQPGYIDGLPDYPYSGLVHESGLDLTLDNLREQHQMMDVESASLGFPVIETFLWREPLAESWVPGAGDSAVIERRHRYLSLARDSLLAQLGEARQRWQPEGAFDQLTRAGQQRLVWQSLQRLAQVELLGQAFADNALQDPAWHHPSALAGQGRAQLLARLDGIEALLGTGEEDPGPLHSWLGRRDDLEVSPTTLNDHLVAARAGIEQLPENYPFDTADDDDWQAARRAVAQLAVDFNTLSRQMGLAVITD